MKNTLTVSFFFFGLGVALAARLPSTRLLSARTTSGAAAPSHLGIYQGHDASIEKHPHIVALFRGKFHCAGSIIGRSWVLISGDCAYKSTPDILDIYAGSTNVSLGTHYAVKKIVTHPKYDPAGFGYDFALLQIKGKFKWSKNVKKIALPKKEIEVGSEVVVAGWGDTKSNSQPTPLLQEGSMTVMSLDDCAAKYTGFSINFTNSMDCVYNEKSTSLCEGDWSDPITQDGVLYCHFIGIAEQYICTNKAWPSICGKVLSAVPWIKEVIKEEYDDDDN